MADESRGRKDGKAAREAIEILLSVLPKSEKEIYHIAHSFGLISRETGIPVERATDFIIAWSERLRTAVPDFRERYPRYRKPSLYRYQVQYAVQSAYKRVQEMPSTRRFMALTGKSAPPASFWARPGQTGEERPLRKGRPRQPDKGEEKA
ncbi:MAG: hypothetical protein M0Z67_05235 [Nitrospiraceae bacterium]|nr:hypothetical protein [Nitrospiraceae bacterium]